MTHEPRLLRIVEAQPYPLLFATISGAHLYGFPSPDSDVDLRGTHVLPLERVVGLEVRDETVEDSNADLALHEREYARLRLALQAAQDASPLLELPDEGARAALNALLIRIRVHARATDASGGIHFG